MVHELNTRPEQFAALWSREKTCEIRKADRDFQVRDLLVLKEYRPETDEYSGREIDALVTNIQAGFGLPQDLVVLSIRVTWCQETKCTS
jgi:hypothetical protein